MSERTEVSFDAALMMALRADAQKELDELPSPAQLKERYPDTSRWDARLQAALHKRRPVLKRVLIAVLTLVILTLGALAVSAEFRRAVYLSTELPTNLSKMPELVTSKRSRAVAVWTSVKHPALKICWVYFRSILISL